MAFSFLSVSHGTANMYFYDKTCLDLVRVTVLFLKGVTVVTDGACIQVFIQAQFFQLGDADALTLTAAAARADVADNAGIPADRVTIHRMVNRAVADAAFLHVAHHLLESFQVLRRVAVQLDIRDVARIGQRVIGRLQTDLLARRDVVIDRDMERVGIELVVGDPFDLSIKFPVDPYEPACKPFGRVASRV